MAVIPATSSGAVHHGTSTLSHAERQAAINALSKLKSASGRLGSTLTAVKHSATLLGGAAHKPGLAETTLIHGSGHDTFIGGARTTGAASAGNDTVLSGSTRTLERGSSAAHLTQMAGHPGLGTDTIALAGTTAASIKATLPDEKGKAHTVVLDDKTKVTISGLSDHDISKLHH
jgi:hypothetical protein